MSASACQCGSIVFERKYASRGVWTQFVELKNGKAEAFESETDGLKLYGEPKFMRCVDCKRRFPNPDFKESK